MTHARLRRSTWLLAETRRAASIGWRIRTLHSDPVERAQSRTPIRPVGPIVATHRKLVSARGDLDTARELAADDEILRR